MRDRVMPKTSKSRHARSIDSIHAQSWDDNSPSTSLQPQPDFDGSPWNDDVHLSIYPHAQLEHRVTHISQQCRLTAHRPKHARSMLHSWVIAVCLLSVILLAQPVKGLLSDPGVFEEDVDSTPHTAPISKLSEPPLQQSLSSKTVFKVPQLIESFADAFKSPPPEEVGSLLPALYQSKRQPVSLPPGCHLSTDLLSRSSLNPWTSAAIFSQSGNRGLSPRSIRSELIVCPLQHSDGKIQDGEDVRLFSITGILAVISAAEGGEAFTQSEALRTSASGDQAADNTPWPDYGQETPGFWRQRDGQLHWEPQEIEPLPLVSPAEVQDTDSAKSAPKQHGQASDAGSHAEKSQSPTNASKEPAEEYHAWTAAIGGESADEWLSFAEWKSRHLAEKERAETERRAAEAKAKKSKHKHHSVTTHTQSPATNQTSSQTLAAPESNSRDSKEMPNQASDERHDLRQPTQQDDPTPSFSTTSLPSGNAKESSSSAKTGTSASEVKTSVAAKVSGSASQSPEKAQHSTTSETQAEAARPSDDATAIAPPEMGDETASPPSSSPADLAPPDSVPAIRDPAGLLKNLKHRWNFASMDCAAVVHRTNPSAKFAASILTEKKDRYMLAPCPDTANGDTGGNFVVVELCDEISLDTIVLANYEFFSRMFKRFRVSVASALKGGGSKEEEKWYELGTFRARNVRGVQVFNTTLPQDFKAPTRFFRYVRVDFLEYYGNEFYCPISLLRVYGLTQLDDYRREEEEERKALEASQLLTIGDDAESDYDSDNEEVPEGEEPLFEIPSDISSPAADDEGPWEAIWTDQKVFASTMLSQATTAEGETPADSQSVEARTVAHVASPTANTTANASAGNHSIPSGEDEKRTTSHSPIANQTASSTSEATQTKKVSGAIASSRDSAPSATNKKASTETRPSSCNATSSAQPRLDQSGSVSTCAKPTVSTAVPASTVSNARKLGERNGSNAASASSSVDSERRHSQSAPSSVGSQNTAESSRSTQQAPLPPPPPASASGGATTDSIYRSISKRLNALEANATLSLQYIEHSGQMLREIFKAMERRQEGRLGDMLRALNSSNWRQIEALKRRQQVDLQKAIFEFDGYRQETESERRALLAEVRLLTNEVMFERRLGLVQLTLVLGLFVFMALTRGPSASPSLLQAGMAKLASVSPPVSNLKVHPSRSASAVLPARGTSDATIPPLAAGATETSPNRRHASLPLSADAKTTALEIEHVGAADPAIRSVRSRNAMRSSSGPLQQSQTVGGSKANKMLKIAVDNRLQHGTPDPLVDDSSADMSPMVGTPPADFAEMSDSELRSYLGFTSPKRRGTSLTPVNGNENRNPFGAAYETGDEGAQTAYEDLDGLPDHDDDDEDDEDDDEGGLPGAFHSSTSGFTAFTPPRRPATAEGSLNAENSHFASPSVTMSLLRHSGSTGKSHKDGRGNRLRRVDYPRHSSPLPPQRNKSVDKPDGQHGTSNGLRPSLGPQSPPPTPPPTHRTRPRSASHFVARHFASADSSDEDEDSGYQQDHSRIDRADGDEIDERFGNGSGNGNGNGNGNKNPDGDGDEGGGPWQQVYRSRRHGSLTHQLSLRQQRELSKRGIDVSRRSHSPFGHTGSDGHAPLMSASTSASGASSSNGAFSLLSNRRGSGAMPSTQHAHAHAHTHARTRSGSNTPVSAAAGAGIGAAGAAAGQYRPSRPSSLVLPHGVNLTSLGSHPPRPASSSATATAAAGGAASASASPETTPPETQKTGRIGDDDNGSLLRHASSPPTATTTGGQMMGRSTSLKKP